MPNLYPGHRPSYGIGRLYVFLLIAVVFPYFVLAQPTISSFSPATGPVGTTVTITGSNFSAAPAANIVYFGAVRATVSTASTSSLAVTVPTGTSYQPITVTTGGLTAFSALPFITTFADTNHFTPNKFSQNFTLPAGYQPQTVFSVDLDGDGKPDLLVATGDSLAMYLNKGSAGTISFARQPSYVMSTSPIDYPVGVTAGDLDGDGKPDIVVTNFNSATIAVFRNTSTAGNISLAAPVYYPATANSVPVAAVIGDLNGDGKPEIITACPGNDAPSTYNALSIYSNNSTPGNLSFTQNPDLGLPSGSYPAGVVIGDFDGDGKPDLATENLYTSVVSIFRNTSVTNGAISFVSNIDFPTGLNPFGLAAGDLDGDGKPDLAVANNSDGTISLLRNTSTAGSLSFDPQITMPAGTTPQGIGITDLDGDGKPDLAVGNTGDGTISLYRNTGSSGTISVAAAVNYAVGVTPQYVTMADFDGDGKPDLVTSNNGDNTLSVMRNKGPRETAVISFSPATGYSGSTVRIVGVNFTGATTVSLGGTPVAAFTVVSDSIITATVGTGASGAVMVVAPAGTASLNGFTFTLAPPHIHSFTPASGPAGTTVLLTGTGFTSMATVSFGGVPAATFTILSDATISAVVGTGATGPISVIGPPGTDTTTAVFTYTIPVIPPPPTPLDITSFSPASGSTGTQITIDGKYLSTATAVSFGGTAAQSFTILSDSVIIAVVGAGSSGQVIVTGTNGADTLSGFTYTTPVPLTYKISSFSPAGGTTGTTIAITGTNLTGATSVTFGGIPAFSFTVTSDSTITAIVGAGASGQVKVSSLSWQDSLPGFTYTIDTTHTGSSTPGIFQLLQFTGALSNNRVVLNWSARNDNSLEFYVVERGSDSTQFVVLTSIQPITKTVGNHNYTFTDPSPQTGDNYYRIKMVDTSGSFTYSQAISFQSSVATTKHLSVYPNPVKYGWTLVDVPATTRASRFQVADMSGSVIRTQDVAPNITQVRIDLSGVIKGTYKLVWSDGVNFSWQTILVLQ